MWMIDLMLSKPLYLFYIFFVTSVLLTMSIFYFKSRNKQLPDKIDNKLPSALLGKWIRAYWLWVCSPVERACVYLRINPNSLSILGGLTAIIAAILFARGNIGAGGCLLIFSGSLDFFDGRVARATQATSSFKGKYIDGILDRFCDATVLIGISWNYRSSPLLLAVLFLMLASFMIPFNRTQGELLGVHYSGGTTQRAERIVYLGFGAILSSIIALFIFPWASVHYNISSLNQLTSMLFAIPLSLVSLLASLTAIGMFIKIYRMIES